MAHREARTDTTPRLRTAPADRTAAGVARMAVRAEVRTAAVADTAKT